MLVSAGGVVRLGVMANQRAAHKALLQGWIDKKVWEAFRREADKRNLTRAEFMELCIAKQLKVKPSDTKSARTGLPSGKQRIKHGQKIMEKRTSNGSK